MDELIQSARSQSAATQARAVAAASRVFLQFARSNRSQTSKKLFLFSCKLKGFTFTIEKYVIINFQPSGVISAYKEYNDSAQNFKIFKPNAVICNKGQLGIKKETGASRDVPQKWELNCQVIDFVVGRNMGIKWMDVMMAWYDKCNWL